MALVTVPQASPWLHLSLLIDSGATCGFPALGSFRIGRLPVRGDFAVLVYWPVQPTDPERIQSGAALMGLDSQQYQRLIERLTGFGMSRGLVRQDAEDCAQEAVLVLADKYSDKDEVEAVPLAFGIIRRKISEHRRRTPQGHGLVVSPIDGMQIEDPSAGAALLRRREIQDAFYAALGELDSKCRRLLLLQLEGYSGDEIAARLGFKTRNGVYIAINRCKKRFKASYEALLDE